MEHLKELLREARSVLIAYSGGVDSTFLLTVAHEVLGDQVTAATAFSRVHASHETHSAQQFLKQKKIRQILLESEEMTLAAFSAVEHRGRIERNTSGGPRHQRG
jgi:uncharacterized protein